MPRTTNARLPDGAYCPRVESVREADLLDRVWQRAQTLFDTIPDGVDPDKRPDTGYVADYLGEGRYLLYKPRLKKPELGEFTERRYIVDAVQQTCTCPFFTGIDTPDWDETFTVRKEGNRVVVEDGYGNVVHPKGIAHAYCKHVWSVLLQLAREEEGGPDGEP